MHDVAGLIGAITGSCSLLGIAFFLGVWRGKVDSALRDCKETIKSYPPAEMWTMTKTLWDIYVISALHNRTDLAEHGSGFKLKEEGENLIPDHIKKLLVASPHNPYNREDIATGYLVVKSIGMNRIQQMAEEKKLTVQEAIAILSCYLDAHRDDIS